MRKVSIRTLAGRGATAAAIIAVSASALMAQQPANWVAHIQPCGQSGELMKRGHMELGVWLNTANPSLAVEFRRALEFWSRVVDMRWHERSSEDCSIQLIDGGSSLFYNDLIAARSQLVDRQLFRGWIAFNPRCKLSDLDAYLTAIHELGHILGLRHNSNPKSVMYFLDPDAPPLLDPRDLAALARRHRLRDSSSALTASGNGQASFRDLPGKLSSASTR